MQFHAKYPLFDSQSDRGFTFSYVILDETRTCNVRVIREVALIGTDLSVVDINHVRLGVRKMIVDPFQFRANFEIRVK